MSVKQDSEPDFDNSRELANTACAEEYLADEQSTLSHAARIAAKFVIERWKDGSRKHCASLNLPHNQSVRARWYANTEQGLQDWIERGGFSQPVDAHDAAALAGAGAGRPIFYRLNSEKPRCVGTCPG